MERIIFHVDVNSAFLSWEAAKRVSEGEEDIRLIPSAIGGDREKRTGVILAKSQSAKRYGIKTGESVSQALIKCPHLFLAKPDFHLYEKCSRAFVEVCRKYSPVVEQYSIDECFLDMSGMERIFPDIIKAAYMLKDEIRDTLGFTVNVGISSNKLLAKMASDFEKGDKVHTLFPDEIENKLFPLPVGDLFTVGRATAKRLEQMKIRTIGELAKTPLEHIKSIIGAKNGEHIHAFANGIDPSPVISEAEKAKGYSISTTLEEDVRTVEKANRVLLSLADSVTSRMRADKAKCLCISVTIRSNDFKNKSHQKTLSSPTDVTGEVYRIAKELFLNLWDKRTPLRLLGIALMHIDYEGNEQQSFFKDEHIEKERKVDLVIDSIRSRFGTDTIVRGSTFEGDMNVGKKYKAQIDTKLKNE